MQGDTGREDDPADSELATDRPEFAVECGDDGPDCHHERHDRDDEINPAGHFARGEPGDAPYTKNNPFNDSA